MGSNAVVIGASTGIGLAAVSALASAGFNVWGTVRSEEGALAVSSVGGRAVRMELRDEQSVADAVEELLAATGGRLDVLVLNAGVGQPGAVEDVPLSAWRDTFESNLFGPLAVLQGLMPGLRAAKSGRVIWVSSVLGMMALGFRGAYVATKFAMEGVADAMRIELAAAGIHVAVVQPGPVATRFRQTARARFDQVNREASVHAEAYKGFARRMEKPDLVGGDTEPPEAVGAVIVEAATAARPRARYRVCRSTNWVEWMRRLAPRDLTTWIGIRALKRECEGN